MPGVTVVAGSTPEGSGRDNVDAAGNGDEVAALDGWPDTIHCYGSQATVLMDSVDAAFQCPNASVP